MKRSVSPSVRYGLFIVVLSWFGYTAYRFDRSIDWLVKILTSQVQLTIGEPFLPIFMGTVGLGVRTVGTLVALVALIIYLTKRDFSKTFRMISLAIFLEALYFLTFIPAAISSFFFPGMPLVFVESGIPIMTQATVMPLALLNLRSKVVSQSRDGVVKWGLIVGVMYLFVFWLNFTMQWVGTFIMPETYASAYPGYGINYVLNYPLNMFSFLLTSIGLLFLMVFFALSSASSMRGSLEKLSTRRTGVAMTLLGGYFILIYFLFVIFGPVGGYSIWNAVFIYFIVDHWCFTLPALGIPLMLDL